MSKRVKISYTISGYNKYVIGLVVLEDDDFITVLSDKRGDTVKLRKTLIDETIEIRGVEE